MYNLLTAALVTLTATTTPVSYTAEEAQRAAISSVMTAYELGHIEIGRKFPLLICAHAVGLPPESRSFKLHCSVDEHETLTPTLTFTVAPSTEQEGMGGDDAYAADGSIRVWVVQTAASGARYKVTTTVQR